MSGNITTPTTSLIRPRPTRRSHNGWEHEPQNMRQLLNLHEAMLSWNELELHSWLQKTLDGLDYAQPLIQELFSSENPKELQQFKYIFMTLAHDVMSHLVESRAKVGLRGRKKKRILSSSRGDHTCRSAGRISKKVQSVSHKIRNLALKRLQHASGAASLNNSRSRGDALDDGRSESSSFSFVDEDIAFLRASSILKMMSPERSEKLGSRSAAA